MAYGKPNFRSRAKRSFAARKVQRKYRSYRSKPKLVSLIKKVTMRQMESKYAETDMGTLDPTAAAPAILALNMPDTLGPEVRDRIGSEVSFTHFSAKLRCGKWNGGDVRSGCTLTAHVLVLKNGMFASSLEAAPGPYLFQPDFNGDYTPLCYTNQTNWNNYFSIAKIHCTMNDLVPVAQIPFGMTSATGTANTGSGAITNPNQASMTNNELSIQNQLRYRYFTINKRIRVKSRWGNYLNVSPAPDQLEVSRNKFYIVVTTDLQSQEQPSGTSPPRGRQTDRIFLQGTCRLTFKDG